MYALICPSAFLSVPFFKTMKLKKNHALNKDTRNKVTIVLKTDNNNGDKFFNG